jgi:hypothetical protein
MLNLSKEAKFSRLKNAVAAGQTAVNSDGLDMAGFEGAQFIVCVGTVDATGTVTAKLQEDDDSEFGTAADLEGTSIAATAADDNGLLLIDLLRPGKRYARVVIARGTADSVIDAILAVRYMPRTKPVAQDDDSVIGSETHYSPAAGTA